MEVINLLSQLLKFKSITPDDDGVLDFIANYMHGWDAKRLDFLSTQNEYGVKNLILSKRFGDGVSSLCFAGHIDVVPPGDGWDSDPFIPVQSEGYIYARGTQDMKGGVAAFLQACKDFECKHAGKDFDGTIYIILTSDEEGDGINGTLHVLKYMKDNNLLPDFAIVAEPTCSNIFGDTIKIGRRGSINGKISILGIQGHVAYPEKCVNPAHGLAKVFHNIADYDLDKGNEFFSPSKIVITDIRGGMQVSNVTPDRVDIMFNVRNSNLTNEDSVRDYLKGVLDNLDYGLKYELSLKVSSKPFLTDKQSHIVKALSNSITKITKISPELNTKGGTSDARYFSSFGVLSVEFGVINDRIHAKNERVSIDEIYALYKVFGDLLKNFNIN